MEEVKTLRIRLELSQQAFATKCGLSIRSVANYDQGTDPSTEALARFYAVAGYEGFHDLTRVFYAQLTDRLGPIVKSPSDAFALPD